MHSDSSTIIEYTFTTEEACAAAYGTGRLRPYKKRSIFQTIVAVFAIIFFISEIISQPSDVFAYIMVITGILLIISCHVFPRLTERDFMREYGMLAKRIVSFDSSGITLQREGGALTIEPKDVINSGMVGEVIIITSNNGSIIELPIRAASDDELKRLDALIK